MVEWRESLRWLSHIGGLVLDLQRLVTLAQKVLPQVFEGNVTNGTDPDLTEFKKISVHVLRTALTSVVNSEHLNINMTQLVNGIVDAVVKVVASLHTGAQSE